MWQNTMDVENIHGSVISRKYFYLQIEYISSDLLFFVNLIFSNWVAYV